MLSPFKYSDTNKRYYTYTYYNRKRFGCRVVKIPLNAGFTCPNIDGRCGSGGCTYCSSSGSGEFAGRPEQPLAEQFEQGVLRMQSKWPDGKYIAYFQAHTNTYAPLERLRECFEPFAAREDVLGISIATRADCLDSEVLDYLQGLSQRTCLTVELGLQSAFDDTGERINRCHSFAQFERAVRELSQRGIRTCVHLINGLPGEDRERMLETIRVISHLPIDAVKLHLLHIIEGTVMAQQYRAGELKTLERDEYVSIICDQLERLREDIVVERITGDGEESSLIAPMWSLDKRGVINAIDKEMARRGSCQGERCEI